MPHERTDMSHSPVRSTLNIDEKSDVDIAFNKYHEQHAGRLVLDPEYILFAFSSVHLVDRPCNSEARIEFGENVASHLKLSPDGKTVLWPQPADDPEDPQNVRLCLLICH